MSILKIKENFYNTPHIAPKEREDVPLQVGHSVEESFGIPDLWLHPEKFRTCGTTDKHSLDILA